MSEARSLLKHSPIYMLGTLLERGSAFLLLLIYTHYLSTGEYGTMGLVLVTSEMISLTIAVPVGAAMGRFFFDSDDEQLRRRVVSTTIIAMVSVILLALYPLALLAAPLSRAVLGPGHEEILYVGMVATSFGTLLGIGLNYFRLRRLSWIVVSISVIRSVCLIGSNCVLVIGLGLGLRGVFYGILAVNVVFALGVLKDADLRAFPRVVVDKEQFVSRADAEMESFDRRGLFRQFRQRDVLFFEVPAFQDEGLHASFFAVRARFDGKSADLDPAVRHCDGLAEEKPLTLLEGLGKGCA